MTRLYYDIIKDISPNLGKLDRSFELSTGYGLLDLAARTIAKPTAAVSDKLVNYSAAVVPITSGEGLIPGFVDSVEAILSYLGLEAFITAQTDVGGFGEAYNKGAELIFAADDRKFTAFNLRTRSTIDNSWATAVGFVEALAGAAEKSGTGIKGRDVLVLGLGPVGKYAVEELQKHAAKIWVFDKDSARKDHVVGRHSGINPVTNLEEAFANIRFVYDATPASEIITEQMIQPTTIISCPGVPHGLTPAAFSKMEDRLIHDQLPLGVAIMAVQCVFSC